MTDANDANLSRKLEHITGIGGIFFKANDPEKLGEWYRKHLGLDVEEFGGVTFRENEASPGGPNDRLTLFGHLSLPIPTISLQAKSHS